jgi:ribosomal protein S18 acetylase RimI-like enzyme
MGPHSYAKSVSSCAPLLWGAAAGALLWAAGFPVAGACATASAALFFTPLGSAALNGALWLAIRAQKLGFPPAGSTAAQFFVAEAGGELLGCVCVKEAHTLYREAERGVAPPPGEASVWRLTVAPAARRLGVGRQLMASAEAWAAARGCASVTLVTGNPESAKFYRRIGYGGESEARARRALWGARGAPTTWLGKLREQTLPKRCATTIFVKALI